MSDLLKNFYSRLYLSEKHDSPDRSRISLILRIRKILNTGIPNNKILNIGSGPQSIERQLWSIEDSSKLKKFDFSTIDVANIQPYKLLKKSSRNVAHTQASALMLPYANESFGLVFSNHAIDFLPKSSFDEAFRVLKNDGLAVFYFHHPDMIPSDIERVQNAEIKSFWSYLRDNDLLFHSEERIALEMSGHGFNINSINLNQDNKDKWWEVELTKQARYSQDF